MVPFARPVPAPQREMRERGERENPRRERGERENPQREREKRACTREKGGGEMR